MPLPQSENWRKRKPQGVKSAPSWKRGRTRQRRSPPPSIGRKKKSRITWNTFGKVFIPRGDSWTRFLPSAEGAGSCSGNGTGSRRRPDVPSAREKRSPTRLSACQAVKTEIRWTCPPRIGPTVRDVLMLLCFSVCFMKVPVQVKQSPCDRFILVKPFLKPVIGFPKSVI